MPSHVTQICYSDRYNDSEFEYRWECDIEWYWSNLSLSLSVSDIINNLNSEVKVKMEKMIIIKL